MDIHKIVEVSILGGKVAVVFEDAKVAVLTGEELRTLAAAGGTLLTPSIEDDD